MTANNQESASVSESKKENQEIDRSRRSFSKLGVTLGPVMMILGNRSAWAGGNHCTSYDAFVSYLANPAMSHGVADEILGWKTPTEWGADESTLDTFIKSIWGNGNDANSQLKKLWPTEDWDDGNTKVIDALNAADLDGYHAATLLNQLVQAESVLVTLIGIDDLTTYRTFYSSVCLTGEKLF